MAIDPKDLQVTSIAEEAGGMSTGAIPRGVTINHIPTGIRVSCDEFRHQYLNKAECLRILEVRLCTN